MSSVVVKRVDRARIEAAVASYVAWLRSRPEVTRVIWFGSWVGGIPTPGSDVDLCVLLSHSDLSFRDRIPEYLPGRFPVGIDLFPYTEAELERLRLSSPTWYTAIVRGREMP